MHKSSVYLSEGLKGELALMAQRTGRSEAEIIRTAIEHAVAGAASPVGPVTEVSLARPSVVGVGVGPGDPGLVTGRAAAVLRGVDRVIVATTDERAVGRAEMVVRAVAPSARVHRVAYAIGSDSAGRTASTQAVVDAVIDAADGGDAVAVAVVGDPAQWSIFPDVAAQLAARRPALAVTAEPGITAYQVAAAELVVSLGQPSAALVVSSDVDDLARHPDACVVLYKAATDGRTVRAAASRADRSGTVAELHGLPGDRLTPVDGVDDGPLSYLATIVFPAPTQAVEAD